MPFHRSLHRRRRAPSGRSRPVEARAASSGDRLRLRRHARQVAAVAGRRPRPRPRPPRRRSPPARRPIRPPSSWPSSGPSSRCSSPARSAPRPSRPPRTSSTPRSDLTHASVRPEPSAPSPPRSKGCSRVSAVAILAIAFVLLQGRHGAVVHAARRPASTRRRRARSPRRSTSRASPTSCATTARRSRSRRRGRAGADRARRRGRQASTAARARATSCSTSRSSAPPTSSSRSPTSARWRVRSPARSAASRASPARRCSSCMPAGRPVRRRGDAGHGRRHARQLGRHARPRRGARHRPARRLLGQGPEDRQRHDHRLHRHRSCGPPATAPAARPAWPPASRRRGPLRRARSRPTSTRCSCARSARARPRSRSTPTSTSDKTTREELTYAKKGVPLKTQTETEKLKGGGATTGGTAGTGSNIPTYSAGTAGGGANSNYQRKSGTTDFGVDKKVDHTEIAPGAVNKLQRRAARRQDASRPPTSPSLQKAVGSAAGIDTDARRHDARPPQMAVRQGRRRRRPARCPTTLLGPLKWVGLGLAALLFLFFMTRGCASARARRSARRRG